MADYERMRMATLDLEEEPNILKELVNVTKPKYYVGWAV